MCAITALRKIYHRRDYVSLGLVLLGVVTFCFTHALFLVLFLLCANKKSFVYNIRLLLALGASFVLLYFLFLRPAVDALLILRRFQI